MLFRSQGTCSLDKVSLLQRENLRPAHLAPILAFQYQHFLSLCVEVPFSRRFREIGIFGGASLRDVPL
jgi:hypothetical protein